MSFGVWYVSPIALYQVCSNYDPRAKKGHTPGLICFHRKTLKKIYFSKTAKPRALLFSMYYHLMALYLVCSNNDSPAKNGHTPGHRGFHRKIFKKSSSLKPLSLNLSYWVCSFTYWSSPKFVQLMTPRAKNGPAPMFKIGHYIGI